MRSIKMVSLTELTEGALHGIRKTAEDPPKVSVLDVIAAVTGDASNCSTVYTRLREQFPRWLQPQVKSSSRDEARGKPWDTPITCVEGGRSHCDAPTRTGGGSRSQTSCVNLVRYLGGNLSLVDEIDQNHLTQQELDVDHPARLFGQTVESDRVKRAREEVTIAELDGQLKRRRIESIQYCLEALENVCADDRDRCSSADMWCSVALGSSSSMYS